MASLAVSLVWWSKRNNLSRKSRASGLTKCWLSLWTNRSHRLRECLTWSKCKLAKIKLQKTVLTMPGYKEGSPSQNVIKSRLQLNVVFINAIIKIFCSKNFSYSHQLWRNRNIVINSVNTTPKVKTNNCIHICYIAHVTIWEILELIACLLLLLL